MRQSAPETEIGRGEGRQRERENEYLQENDAHRIYCRPAHSLLSKYAQHSTPLNSTEFMLFGLPSAVIWWNEYNVNALHALCVCDVCVYPKNIVYNYLIKPESWYKILLLKRWLCIIYNAFSFRSSSFFVVPLHRSMVLVLVRARALVCPIRSWPFHCRALFIARYVPAFWTWHFGVATIVISHVSINELSACVARSFRRTPSEKCNQFMTGEGGAQVDQVKLFGVHGVDHSIAKEQHTHTHTK